MNYLEYPFDAGSIFRYKRKIKRELKEKLNNPIAIKIAVLGGSTTNNLADILELFLMKYNISAEFYQSEYGQYWEDAIFGNEDLDSFKPDMIYIHTSNRNISSYPDVTFSENDTKELVASQYKHFEKMWDNLFNKFGCPIIQNNFDMLFYRLLGNRDSYDFRGKNYFISELNKCIYEYANSHNNFYINDINYLSAAYGLENWNNLNDWYRYKSAMAVNAIPEVASNIASLIKAIYGKNKKFLAIDLDNTLWGGVIGDDGVSGVEIGNETYEGQAYLEFQKYISEVSKLGVVLTVNSKNDHENAIAGLNHPEGVLKEKDFAIIKANWDNKNQNIVDIARELNLGIDSGVFLDDNPVEREIVTSTVTGVDAPVFDDIANYIKNVDRNSYFEMISISADDIKRGEMYKANAQRRQAQVDFADYNEFLLSLNMNAEICKFNDIYMPRIVQLTNKSNQFNLTTKRYTSADVEAINSDPNSLCLYGKLEDKFGDNGIVAVSIGHIEDEVMYIDLWLMSCRVLKRNMENAMMDEFVELSKQMGAEKIVGVYYPTAKNAMVKDFYGKMGFEKIFESEEETRWEMSVASYENGNNVINVNKGE